MEHVRSIPDADGVAGIMATLISGDAGEVLREDIDDFAFTFVAPLNANDCEVI
jgi:hypothetical protein